MKGDCETATKLATRMQGPYTESYQPVGNVRLVFTQTGTVKDYVRSLDLEHAVAHTRFRIGDAFYERETFASYPDKVIVYRLSCDKPGLITFTLSADSPLRFAVQAAGPDALVLSGRAPAHVDPSYMTSDAPIRYDDGLNPEANHFFPAGE